MSILPFPPIRSLSGYICGRAFIYVCWHSLFNLVHSNCPKHWLGVRLTYCLFGLRVFYISGYYFNGKDNTTCSNELMNKLEKINKLSINHLPTASGKW